MEEDKITQEIVLASRWSRLWAVIVDGLIMVAISYPVMSYYNIFELINIYGAAPVDLMINITIYSWVMFFIINGKLLSKYGQSIGKWIFGIAIVTTENETPGFWRIALRRYLPVYLIAYIPVIGNLSQTIDALFIFNKSKRCIHDFIAGTIVIDKNANKASQPTPKNGAAEL